jgi:hypothetical protein
MELGGGGTMYTYVSKCKNDKRRKKSDRKKERKNGLLESIFMDTLYASPQSIKADMVPVFDETQKVRG